MLFFTLISVKEGADEGLCISFSATLLFFFGGGRSSSSEVSDFEEEDEEDETDTGCWFSLA